MRGGADCFPRPLFLYAETVNEGEGSANEPANGPAEHACIMFP